MKKVKNKYEIMDLDDVIIELKNTESKLDRVIPKFKKYQDLIETEFRKWDMNDTPSIKNIDKYIKEQEPIMKEYRELHKTISKIKAEIIHKTGIKEHELKDFYKFYNFKKVLDQANSFAGIV